MIKKENGACKSHLSQSAAGTLWSSSPPQCSLFDEFVSCEISQVTTLLYFLTWLLILETRESILKLWDLILESFEIQDLSLKKQDASDCQLTFEQYRMLLLYPACFVSFSLKELYLLHTLFIIKVLGHITHHFWWLNWNFGQHTCNSGFGWHNFERDITMLITKIYSQ